MVKEEKWNINDLKNINYNKVKDLFFLSVSKIVLDLFVMWGVSVQGGKCPGGICLEVSVRGPYATRQCF